MEKSTHRVEVVPVELRPHPNADTLSLVRIFGYQCVVKTADWTGKAIGAYIPPDSVVPDTPDFSFVHGAEVGTATIRQRRIKARRFRGEWSQGLLMPAPVGAKIGDDVAARLGVTHYEPPEDVGTKADAESFPRKGYWPRSLKGWFFFFFRKPLIWLGILDGRVQGYREAGPDILFPKYDVDTWYRYKDLFQEGEPVVLTEKIHGSNARYVWHAGRMYCGSRSEWKREGSNVWWKCLKANPWIERFCLANPDVALYGEVVPTQDLKYGTTADMPRLFPFDVRKHGRWLNWSEIEAYFDEWPELESNWVPRLHRGSFTTYTENIHASAIGNTLTGAGHIREGVVVRPVEERTHPAIGRVQLKIVSPEYLERAK